MTTLTPSCLISILLSSIKRREKRRGERKIPKGKTKLSLFIEDKVIYLEYLRVPIIPILVVKMESNKAVYEKII
jgi:hypothetical protein